MRNALIFDFDGTLVDSLPIMVDAYNQVAAEYGCKTVTPVEVQRLRSMHLRDILFLLKIPYLKLPLLLFATLSIYRSRIATVKLFKGIPEMLCSLKVLGYDLYIVSTNDVETIKIFLKEHEINFFSGIYSCGSNVFGKGSVLKKVLKKNGLTAKDVFYVGDELRDVEAGHQVGMRVIAVSWGYNMRDALAKKADTVVDSPSELVSFFKAGRC